MASKKCFHLRKLWAQHRNVTLEPGHPPEAAVTTGAHCW